MDNREFFIKAFSDIHNSFPDNETIRKDILERAEKMNNKEKNAKKREMEIIAPAPQEKRHSVFPVLAGTAAVFAVIGLSAAGLKFVAENGGLKQQSPYSPGYSDNSAGAQETTTSNVQNDSYTAAPEAGDQAEYTTVIWQAYAHGTDETTYEAGSKSSALYKFDGYAVNVTNYEFDGKTLNIYYDVIFDSDNTMSDEKKHSAAMLFLGNGSPASGGGMLRSESGNRHSWVETVILENPVEVSYSVAFLPPDVGDNYDEMFEKNKFTAFINSEKVAPAVGNDPAVTTVTASASYVTPLDDIADFTERQDIVKTFDYDEFLAEIRYEFDGKTLNLVYDTTAKKDSGLIARDLEGRISIYFNNPSPVNGDDIVAGYIGDTLTRAATIVLSEYADEFEMVFAPADSDGNSDEIKNKYSFTAKINTSYARPLLTGTYTADSEQTTDYDTTQPAESSVEWHNIAVGGGFENPEKLAFTDKEVYMLGWQYDGRVIKILLSGDSLPETTVGIRSAANPRNIPYGLKDNRDGTYTLWAFIDVPDGSRDTLELLNFDTVMTEGVPQAGGSIDVFGIEGYEELYNPVGVDMDDFGIKGARLEGMTLSSYGLELLFSSADESLMSSHSLKPEITGKDGTVLPVSSALYISQYDGNSGRYYISVYFVPDGYSGVDILQMSTIDICGLLTKVSEFMPKNFWNITDSTDESGLIPVETAVQIFSPENE